jgi:uncharacterized protein YigA (DUF484 family)
LYTSFQQYSHSLACYIQTTAEAKYRSTKAALAESESKLEAANAKTSLAEAEVRKLRPHIAELQARAEQLTKKRQTNEDIANAYHQVRT